MREGAAPSASRGSGPHRPSVEILWRRRGKAVWIRTGKKNLVGPGPSSRSLPSTAAFSRLPSLDRPRVAARITFLGRIVPAV